MKTSIYYIDILLSFHNDIFCLIISSFQMVSEKKVSNNKFTHKNQTDTYPDGLKSVCLNHVVIVGIYHVLLNFNGTSSVVVYSESDNSL